MTSGKNESQKSSFLHRWFLVNSALTGLLALAWLVLRSAAKPSRLTYPCQQAALSTAMLALAAPIASAVIAARKQLAAGLKSPKAVLIAFAAVVVTIAAWGLYNGAEAYLGPSNLPAAGTRSDVFHVRSCPEQPAGDRFAGLDALLGLMGSGGLKLYESATAGTLAGPAGIVGSSDVVIIKINYQWDQRGGTNVDLLRGLIRAIIDHPDGFFGEIVVCENAQFASVNGFDRTNNNAQENLLSPHDVVTHFQGLGHTVSHFDWTSIRYSSVSEYSSGLADRLTDGYIVYSSDPVLDGAISYPKFQTDEGTRVSLRDGIWDEIGATYDRSRLKLINLPVLKSHSATYGVTATVKNYMGLVTGELSTNSHTAIGNGLLGAVIAEIGLADLNILDCIWINANPYDGPWTSYEGATRRNELVAGVDPVAIDLWAASNILIPAFIDNGYSPPWPNPDANPDDPSSDFRTYLDRSMSYLLTAGAEVTNDIDQIDAFTWDASNGTPLFTDGFAAGDLSWWSTVVN